MQANIRIMYQEAINNYLQKQGYGEINLKAVLFDMDGVLFNSMPNHAEAWHKTMAKFGFTLSREEAYMHEGRTGAGTINIVSLRERGYEATEEEIKQIYQAKSELFNQYPLAERMPGALEVLTKIKEAGLTPMVVTGSGQTSLLDRLNKNFPNIFQRELMVTAFDVKYGKPNPEPYLMALKKGGFQPNEAIVIENVLLYGATAGIIAYLLGRSRRNAFICSVLGLSVSALVTFLINLALGVETPLALGVAGAFDTMVVSTLIAVGLCELIGTTVEGFVGKKNVNYNFEAGTFEEPYSKEEKSFRSGNEETLSKDTKGER